MPNRSPALPSTGDPSWDELAAWWLTRFKPSTAATYRVLLPRWTAWCAEHDVQLLKAHRRHLERFLADVEGRGLARASVAAHYDVVASIYALALEEHLVERSPAAGVRRPKVHRELQRREVLTVLEYAAYLAAARELGSTEHAIAVFAGMLGLRASEMAGLTVESIAIVRGYSTLTFIGKGDKPARMPIPIPALAAVQGVVDGRTSGPLLRTRTGRQMDRRDVYRAVVRTARAAGISRPISPHALRRTVGTVGLNLGVPLRDMQRLLRHARPTTTLQSYDIAGEQLERHASHQVSGFLAGFAD